MDTPADSEFEPLAPDGVNPVAVLESTAAKVDHLLKRGYRRVDIARTLGIATSTVSRHAMRLGHRDHRLKQVRLDWVAIRQEYEAGATVRECQFRFGFSNGAWDGAVARGDIVPRPDPRRRIARRTRSAVEEGLKQGKTLSAIARELEISKATASYHYRSLGWKPRAKFARRYDWKAIQEYYDRGHSRRECAQHFGFHIGSWHKAVERGDMVPRPQAMPVETLLEAGRTRNRDHIKRRLFALGLKENRCEECGISEWRGRALNAALHQINGIKDDNRLDNLRLLCPNCHSQTENFSGRNARHLATEIPPSRAQDPSS